MRRQLICAARWGVHGTDAARNSDKCRAGEGSVGRESREISLDEFHLTEEGGRHLHEISTSTSTATSTYICVYIYIRIHRDVYINMYIYRHIYIYTSCIDQAGWQNHCLRVGMLIKLAKLSGCSFKSFFWQLPKLPCLMRPDKGSREAVNDILQTNCASSEACAVRCLVTDWTLPAALAGALRFLLDLSAAARVRLGNPVMASPGIFLQTILRHARHSIGDKLE